MQQRVHRFNYSKQRVLFIILAVYIKYCLYIKFYNNTLKTFALRHTQLLEWNSITHRNKSYAALTEGTSICIDID